MPRHPRRVEDRMAKTLLAVHRRLRQHPKMHGWLAAFVTRSVGERRVNAAILETTRPGDCVWDVGANVGLYTRQFLERVGPTGHVVAFEPVPENVEQLVALAPEPQLLVVEAALSDTDGEMSLIVSGKSGETSHIGSSSDALTVRVARGDSLLGEGIGNPDIIKIDVEGFEGDVLDGLHTVLRSVRCVVVEVHFAALAQRGVPEEPLRILELLRGHGLTVRWIDTSHVLAAR
jgi:FkbM family methyltransferase